MEKSKIKSLSRILLILLIIFFSFKSFDLFVQKSLPLIKTIPSPNNYRSDEFVFLRTFYLIKGGERYYQAFRDAVTNDSRGGNLTKDVFAWRLPTVFYFWSILVDSGFGIGMLFIGLSSVSLYCVYKITKNILSPIILAPYYLDAYYYQTSLLFTEWWGLFFFIIGLASILYNKKNLAVIFLSLSILTRELFLVPVIFMALASIFFKTNRAVFLKIIFIFLVFYSAHYAIVQNQEVISISRNPLTRIHMFNIKQFQNEIAFSMRQYPLLNFRLPLILAIFTPAILFIKFFLTKKLNYLYFLSAISLLFVTPFFGVTDNDYWGITFMPLIIALSSTAISVLKYSDEK